MANDRIVTCYVTNNLSNNLGKFDIAPGGGEHSGRYNGKWITAPAANLPSGVTTEAFSINRTGPSQGSTGYVIYNLWYNSSTNNNTQLVLMFSNPSSRHGQGSNQNCWFYAIIQGDTTTNYNTSVPVGKDLQVKATVTGINEETNEPWDINGTNPHISQCDNIQVTVTLDYITNF